MRPDQQYIIQSQGQMWGKRGETSFVEKNLKNRSKRENIDFISSLTSSKDGCLEDMFYLEMSDFYSFLEWDRLFVGVIRVERIRSIFLPSRKFYRDLEWEPVKFQSHLLRGSWCSPESKKRFWIYGNNMNVDSLHSQIFDVRSQTRVRRRDDPTPSRG